MREEEEEPRRQGEEPRGRGKASGRSILVENQSASMPPLKSSLFSWSCRTDMPEEHAQGLMINVAEVQYQRHSLARTLRLS